MASSRKKRSSVPVEIPEEYRDFIRNRVVDISKAGRFYQKEWEAIIPRVTNYVKEKGSFQYELNPEFFKYFVNNLTINAGSRLVGVTPLPDHANHVASSLGQAGESFKMWDPSAHVTLNRRLWDYKRPKLDAWKIVDKFKYGIAKETSIEYLGPTKGFVGLDDGENFSLLLPPIENPRLRMSMELDQKALKNKDKNLPKITIELEGEAVGYLLSSCVRGVDIPQKDEAKKLWEGLLKVLEIWTGVKKGRGGKPPSLYKRKAAWWRDQKNLTWAEVADKLCHKDHNHKYDSKGKECAQKYRKAAEKHYKDIEKKGNDNPVNEEME